MKKLHYVTIAGLLLVAGCKKQMTPAEQETDVAAQKVDAAIAPAACQPGMYNLAVDPGTGFSYLFRVSGSPSAGPVSVLPINGSAGTNMLTDCSGAPIRFATGLAYDPTTGIFYGTTGANSSPVNHIFRFTDPNCISLAPAAPSCAIGLDLSDVERDPTTGRFYAINRGSVNPNNRIVVLGLPGAPTVNCLPNFLSPGLTIRGLTFNCTGRLYVMYVNGINGRLLEINKAAGNMVAAYSYPGPITNGPGVAVPEMGLHFDCNCIRQFITGSYHPIAAPTLMTDGLPTGLGGPLYSSLNGVLKPTVDFARP